MLCQGVQDQEKDKQGGQGLQRAYEQGAQEAEEGGAGQEEAQERDGARKDIDYLKRSLEQIAASREKERAKDDLTRNLNPEEIKVLGEIIREYFSGN